MFGFLKRKNNSAETESGFIKQSYDNVNPEFRGQIFYGDATEAEKILKPLRTVLFPDSEPTLQQYSETTFFYTQVWIRKHGGLSPEFSTTPYIKKAMKTRFPSYTADAVVKGVEMCLDYLVQHEPSLAETEIITRTSAQDISDYPAEFLLLLREGSILYEQNKYLAAIDVYKKCLSIKEDGVVARFEIAEAYIKLSQLSNAKDTLYAALPYILADQDKAKLYRRLGFIEIEEGHFDVAAASLLHSLQFEQSEFAINELRYIDQVTGKKHQYSREMILKILRDHEMLFW